MQQAAVYTVLRCDARTSYHHTAAAALTGSIEPVLLLLLPLWLCQSTQYIAVSVDTHTNRQTDAFCQDLLSFKELYQRQLNNKRTSLHLSLIHI